MKGNPKRLVVLLILAFVLWLFVGFEYDPPGYEQDIGMWMPFIKHRPSFQTKFESQLSYRYEFSNAIPLSDFDIRKFRAYCSIRFGKDLAECYNALEDTFVESVNIMRDKGDEYSPVYYEDAIKIVGNIKE